MEKKKVISSLAYKFIERLSVKGLGMIISVVLARMLAPEDFGQIAIMTVFINLSQVIVESGLTTALVQRKDVTDQDYSTVFFINFALAIACFVILQISAPWISAYYNQDITKPLQVYAFTVFFGAFNALQLAKMQKQMQFKRMMVCSLTATVISGAAGIAAAYGGFGIWALIIYNMTNSAVLCIIVAFVQKWLPKLEFSLQRARILFSYGWKMFISAILCSLYNDIRSLVIGKKFSNSDLAYYNRGQQFPQVISNTLDSAIQSVMFPTMATIQDEAGKMRKMLRLSVTTGAYIIIPCMFGLAAVSEDFIRLVLTDKWLPCVPYMQWLCIADAAVPIISSNLIAIKASGRSDVYMRLEMVRRMVMLAFLVGSISLFGTVEAIAIGYCVSRWMDALIVMFPVKKLIHYGVKDQISDLWKTILAAAVMFAAVLSMNLLGWNNLVLLPAQIAAGIVVYLAAGTILGNEAQKNLVKNLKAVAAHKKHG